MNKEYNWPSIEELKNASYCGRRTKAARHTEFLEGTVQAWKSSFQFQLAELVKYKSVDDDVTVEAPHQYGIEYAQLALPLVISFLRVQFPNTSVSGSVVNGEYPRITLDWSTPIPE